MRLLATIIVLCGLTIVIRQCFSSRSASKHIPTAKMERRESGLGGALGRVPTNSLSQPDKSRIHIENGDKPITFHGMVTDQDGKGLPNVVIGYRIVRAGIYLPDGTIQKTDSELSCGTDPAGSFTISGLKGLILEIRNLGKEGYRNVGSFPKLYGYNGTPNIHIPDLKRPVLFAMVPQDTPKPKSVYEKNLSFAWNTGPVKITIPENGISLVLNPKREKAPRQIDNFTWSLDISVEGAGFAKAEDNGVVMAPIEGYSSGPFHYGALKDQAPWHRGFKQRFIFRRSDGMYGEVLITIYPHREDFQLNGVLTVRLNDSGGRNLE